jgi:type I restriction enzyme S subunit
MNPSHLLNHFESISDAPDAIPRLRQFILDLAVRGKLVEQDPKDEPASELLKRIRAEKAQLAKDCKTRAETTLPPIKRDELSFGIPPNWVRAPFGQIMISRDGERIPVSKEERNGRAKTYDYYGASGVIDKIDSYLFDKPLLLIGEDGANLINRSTPIAFIARGKYWVNNHAHVLDGISEGLLRFIELHINAIDLKAYATGTAQPKMNRTKMNSIPIALAPQAEQRRIVAKVDELMGLCDRPEAAQSERENRRDRLAAASLHRLNQPDDTDAPEVFREHARFYLNHLPRVTTRPDQIKQLRQTILNLAVRGQLVPQDADDEPPAPLLGDRQLLLDSQTEPWKLPLGWAWSSFNLIGEVLGGGTPSKADPAFWSGPIPWVSPKDMKVDVITDAQDHISASAVEHSATRLIPRGSLLMVVRGMILAHSFPTSITAVPVTINQDMKAIVPFRHDWIHFLLLVTKGLKPEVLRLVQRSTHGTCKLLTDDLFSYSDSTEWLIQAILLVANGEGWVDHKVMQLIAARYSAKEDRWFDRLTEREHTVLQGVIEGLSNRKIGVRVGISESMIKTTLQRLYTKASVRTRSQLVRTALEASPFICRYAKQEIQPG